jgi:hypothetical protein
MHPIKKLTEVGMDSWIKLSCFILLTGCSSINYSFLKQTPSFEITDEIRISPYAMQTIKLDNNDEGIFFLSKVSGPKQKWFKGIDLFITTHDGKITKTTGLDNDFEITSYKGFKNLINSKALIIFNNPESNYMEIFFSYKIIKKGSMKKIIDNSNFDYRLIEESFSVPLIKWSGKNYYWIDEDDDIWLSKQEIEPFGTKARLQVLKKYSD